MPDNRAAENYYFQNFSRVYDLPFNFKHSDKPDFVSEKNEIGIELTNFFIKKSSKALDTEQQQMPLRKIVLDKARKYFLLLDGSPTKEFSFDFNLEHPINQVEETAKNIAKFAKFIEEKHTERISPFLYNHIPELSYVYLNSKDYTDAEWRLFNCYSTNPIDAERLNDIISEKNKKLEDYANCDNYWLLIVIDYVNAAQDQYIPRLFQYNPPKNNFQKIIIFKTGYDQVYEIQSKLNIDKS